jgi:DNA-binding MarR family transcriptional regulator
MSEGTGLSSHDPIAWTIKYWEDEGIPETSTMLLFSSLARAYQTWLDEVEGILKPLGLGFTRYMALLALMTNEDRALPLNQVSSLILVHPTTITVIIDQLEKSGLVERLPHPTDRRVRLAALTDAGAEAIEIASRELGERNFGMQPLNKRKLESTVKFLTEIRELAGDAVEVGEEAPLKASRRQTAS